MIPKEERIFSTVHIFSRKITTQKGIPKSKSTRTPKSKSTKMKFTFGVPHGISSSRSAPMSRENRAAALRRVSDLSFDDLFLRLAMLSFPPP